VAWADRLEPMVLLVLAAVAVVVITGLRALASYASTVSFALAGNRVLTNVRSQLFGHLQSLSMRYHDHARTGDLVNRLVGDVGRLQEVTVTAALPLAANLLTFVGMIVVMLWVDVGLTLVAVAALPVFAWTMMRLTGRLRTVARRQRELESALASDTAETFGAIKVVQAYTLEPQLQSRFAGSNRASLKDGVKAKRLAAGLERRTDLLVAIATGGVLLFGAQRVLAGALTAGDLVVFMAYLKNAFKPLRDLAKYTGRLAKASASGERILDVLDAEPDIADEPYAQPAPPLRGDVRLHDVTFGYHAHAPVLRAVDLHVAPGQTVAVVGPSGAGKSSVVNLLLRLYDPDQGQVLIDGADLRSFTVASLRRQIAVVLQESVLFAATVRENIAYGNPEASEEDVEAAARLALAHDFITGLPQGYDTVLGERGATLSGGQRQRIAIARAAIRDAPVILLDEPTTGLDGSSAREVIAALRNLGRDRTTIVIAHDLRTVRDADLIVYMDHGRIIEKGRHRELMAPPRGPYARLYDAQQRAASARSAGDTLRAVDG